MSAYSFNANEILTLAIAGYAAVISTFVLGWDAYKWLAAGPKVELTVSTGMKVYGGYPPDDKTYISVTAYNVGDQPTTITNLGGMHFDSWWRAYVIKRKPKQAFLVNTWAQGSNQPVPFRFEIGTQWIGLSEQTDDIVKMARSGYLFLILYTATGGRGKRIRVRLPKKKP